MADARSEKRPEPASAFSLSLLVAAFSLAFTGHLLVFLIVWLSSFLVFSAVIIWSGRAREETAQGLEPSPGKRAALMDEHDTDERQEHQR